MNGQRTLSIAKLSSPTVNEPEVIRRMVTSFSAKTYGCLVAERERELTDKNVPSSRNSSINHLHIYMNMIIIHNFRRDRYSCPGAHTITHTKHTWIYISMRTVREECRSDLLLHHGSNEIGCRKFFGCSFCPLLFQTLFHPYWMRNFSPKIIIVNKLTMNWFFLYSMAPVSSFHVIYYVSLHIFFICRHSVALICFKWCDASWMR